METPGCESILYAGYFDKKTGLQIMNKKVILQWNKIKGKTLGHVFDDEDTNTWAPNTDICEGPDFIIIRMELPGVTRENLQIAQDEQTIIIRGVRPDPACEESAAGYRFRQLEIEYGSFQRAVSMPYPIDAENTVAQLRNGILEVRVSRATRMGQTNIEIIAES